MAKKTPEGAVEVSGVALRAAVRNAQLKAEIVAAALNLMGFGPQRGTSLSDFKFPAGYLLELGALAQLKIWELAGVREFLNANLPTCAEAIADLYSRALTDPSQFFSRETPLADRVLQCWLANMSWESPELLQAEVVLGDVDEDTLIDAVASLLWANRHALNSQFEAVVGGVD